MTINKSDANEHIHQIALKLTKGLGNVGTRKILHHFGNAINFFDHLKSNKSKINIRISDEILQQLSSSSILEEAKKELGRCNEKAIKVHCLTDRSFPQRLKHCYGTPNLLFQKGNADLNAQRTIAIVGTRKPSIAGLEHCDRIVRELSAYDVQLLSGLAYGIDVQAHKSCLKNHIPTIGIVAHGLNHLYPASHQSIAEQMCCDGGILSEYCSSIQVQAQFFPMRNKIIAAMADAILVIETAKKGGSMITAHCAFEYQKDVFALPGAPGAEKSNGCNLLIKTHKAALVESAEDIAYLMNWDKKSTKIKDRKHQQLSKEAQSIMVQFDQKQTLHFDQLLIASEIPTAKLGSILTRLEIEGWLKSLPGRNFRIK